MRIAARNWEKGLFRCSLSNQVDKEHKFDMSDSQRGTLSWLLLRHKKKTKKQKTIDLSQVDFRQEPVGLLLSLNPSLNHHRPREKV